MACVKPGKPEYSSVYVFSVELSFSFIMMAVIMSGKTAKLSLASDVVTGVTYSLIAIYFCASCGGPLTGAVYNANLGLANITFCAAVSGKSDTLLYLPSYVLGGYLGATLAGVYVRFFALRATPMKEAKEDQLLQGSVDLRETLPSPPQPRYDIGNSTLSDSVFSKNRRTISPRGTEHRTESANFRTSES